MKKLSLIVTAMLLFIAGKCVAQQQYVWDFTKGFCNATALLLDQDTENWTKGGTEPNGLTTYWTNTNNSVFVTEGVTAGGQVLSEFENLQITMGNATNTQNNINIYSSGKVRLTRNDMRIVLPQLYNGQTITITGKSANATAENRGIEPSLGPVSLISGQTTNDMCLFLGSNVEGSLGIYTFTWKVITDDTEPQPVEFRMINGGVDLLTIAVNISENYERFTVDGVEYYINSEDQVQVYDVPQPKETVIIPSVVISPYNNKAYVVTQMSPYAFNKSEIKRVELPNTITEIPDNAFRNNQWLETIHLPEALTHIGEHAFQSCTALQSINLYTTASELTIGDYCFRYCSSLVTADIASSPIKELSLRMFSDCTNLKNVFLPFSLQTVGQASFAGDVALSAIALPADVKEVKAWAFNECTNLRFIISHNPEPARLFTDAFGSVSTDATVFVPENATAAFQQASLWNNFSNFCEFLQISSNDEEDYYLQNVWTGQFVTFNENKRVVLADEGQPLRISGPYWSNINLGTNYSFEFINLREYPDPEYTGGWNAAYLSASDNSGETNAGFNGIIGNNNMETWMVVKGDVEGTVRLRYNPFDPDWNTQRGYLYADGNVWPYEVNADGNGYEGSWSLWRIVNKYDVAKLQANGLYAENTTGRAGNTISLPVSMNNSIDIQGIQFDIILPEGVTIPKNGRKWAVTMNTDRAEDFNVSGEEKGDGHYRFVCTSNDAATGYNGNIMTITLQLPEGMEATDYDIYLRDIELSTADSWPIRPKDDVAKLTVKPYVLFGDVNNDGVVSVTDVTAIINFILGKPSYNFNIDAADVNEDGYINVTDVTNTINIILNK